MAFNYVPGEKKLGDGLSQIPEPQANPRRISELSTVSSPGISQERSMNSTDVSPEPLFARPNPRRESQLSTMSSPGISQERSMNSTNVEPNTRRLGSLSNTSPIHKPITPEPEEYHNLTAENISQMLGSFSGMSSFNPTQAPVLSSQQEKIQEVQQPSSLLPQGNTSIDSYGTSVDDDTVPPVFHPSIVETKKSVAVLQQSEKNKPLFASFKDPISPTSKIPVAVKPKGRSQSPSSESGSSTEMAAYDDPKTEEIMHEKELTFSKKPKEKPPLPPKIVQTKTTSVSQPKIVKTTTKKSVVHGDDGFTQSYEEQVEDVPVQVSFFNKVYYMGEW